MLAYSPLAHGLLSGGISEDTEFAQDDWRSGSPLFTKDALRQNLEVVRQLSEIAEQAGCSLSRLAIAWVLDNPAVQVAIVGSRRPEHIEEAVGALDIELGDRERQWIAATMEGAVTAPGPSPEMNSQR